MKTLFLDIDGVLHASSIGELEYGLNGPRVTGAGVCELEGLLASLVAGKELDIAVHSTWVYMFDAKTLANDYLPQLSEVATICVTKRQIQSRGDRIRDHMRRRRLAAKDILILDDAPNEFAGIPALADRLVACNPQRGIADQEVIRRIQDFVR